MEKSRSTDEELPLCQSVFWGLGAPELILRSPEAGIGSEHQVQCVHGGGGAHPPNKQFLGYHLGDLQILSSDTIWRQRRIPQVKGLL